MARSYPARTLVTCVAGEAHVQHLGEGHVVEGSIVEIDLPHGTTAVLRHIGPPAAADVGGELETLTGAER